MRVRDSEAWGPTRCIERRALLLSPATTRQGVPCSLKRVFKREGSASRQETKIEVRDDCQRARGSDHGVVLGAYDSRGLGRTSRGGSCSAAAIPYHKQQSFEAQGDWRKNEGEGGGWISMDGRCANGSSFKSASCPDWCAWTACMPPVYLIYFGGGSRVGVLRLMRECALHGR
ncbi:hypothetical protein TraAM80_03806 [Trypanosoma rangeli]|uniref:Uncharacterized protein n=1 Tax=Trypanosoma rangeli TaxID=5698 RepID=A0A3R7KFN2_TRYRA|nr:uncharacterized protein TraAM80_03806 [Trypanosoma rangeli]RNF06861.1 hypothetical protein TraAM80_03806 [Trypanosoma rangeli]|eukprot:RNF06861.1 hypothetical protein TraAM80_03806 [Trypanosoma rangeli]